MKVMIPPILSFIFCFVVLYWLIWFLIESAINFSPNSTDLIAPIAPILIYVPTLIFSGYIASRLTKSNLSYIKLYLPGAIGFFLMLVVSYSSVTNAQSLLIYFIFGVAGIIFSTVGAGISVWQKNTH